MLILMPLFPAQPLLGPIYVAVDRFMPTDFPLLLVVPALALDLVTHRMRGRVNDWLFAAVAAATFLIAFLIVQWPFADFLMTPAARNALFVSHRMPYSVDPSFQARWYVLKPHDNLTVGLPIALALGYASARCGLWWGNWMARVQR
jgi:hypothetical protein